MILSSLLKKERIFAVISTPTLLQFIEHFPYISSQSKSALELYDNLQKILSSMPCNILNNGEMIGYENFPSSEYGLMVLVSILLLSLSII